MATGSSVTPSASSQSESPIRVQIVPAPKPLSPSSKWDNRRPTIWKGLILFTVLVSIFAAIYSDQTTSTATQSDIHLALTFPNNLAIGDEAMIDLTVTNDSTEMISGTLFLAIDSNPPIHLVDESRTSLELESLAVGEHQSLRVRFYIAPMPPWQLTSNQIHFTPQVMLAGQTPLEYNTHSIFVFSVPYVRFLLTSMFAIAVFLIAPLREHLRDWLIGAG